MTGEERKALSFVAVLLGLSVIARAVNRPEPLVLAGASAVDIQTRLDQNQQVRDRSGKPARASKEPKSPPKEVPPQRTPAWRRPGAGVVIDNRPPGGSAPLAAGPININRATADELDALPGVSPAVAQRIIEYRTARGMLSTIEQLDSVKGVGPALLEKLRPAVRFR